MVSKWRGLIRRFIPEAIGVGLSRVDFQGMVEKELGTFYRRTDFLKDWHEFGGTISKRDPLRAIPKKYRPTEATIERTEFEQIKKFHYNYKAEGYDLITMEDTETFITVASDDILTMEEAEREAERLADKYKLDIDIARMIIDGVTVSK